MKATKEQIKHLADQINEWIENIESDKFHKLIKAYKENEIRTIWGVFWLMYDKEPELWKQEISDLKDDHIETLIKKAIQQTIIPNK